MQPWFLRIALSANVGMLACVCVCVPVWHAIPHKITELVKKTNYSSLLEKFLQPILERFLLGSYI